MNSSHTLSSTTSVTYLLSSSFRCTPVSNTVLLNASSTAIIIYMYANDVLFYCYADYRPNIYWMKFHGLTTLVKIYYWPSQYGFGSMVKVSFQ